MRGRPLSDAPRWCSGGVGRREPLLSLAARAAGEEEEAWASSSRPRPAHPPAPEATRGRHDTTRPVTPGAVSRQAEPDPVPHFQ